MMETISEESENLLSPQKVPSISQTRAPNDHRVPRPNNESCTGLNGSIQPSEDRHRQPRLLNTEHREPPSQPAQTQIQTSHLDVVDRLGEGSFGEVLLVQDRHDPTILLAVKCIDTKTLPSEIVSNLRREALLQRHASNHANVIRYISMRMNTEDVFQIFLEYAGGGELFDQIEPDVGLDLDRCQSYFRQLINGLEYLHGLGIVHRDIKPENLLLDKTLQILKIADFGMATVFRHNGIERVLDTQCGTAPYAAPEVFKGKYKAEPIDVWSAGVVLVTMLVGELPWEKPSRECAEYRSWIDEKNIAVRPWSRMRNEEISILRQILEEDPKKRSTIARIRRHPWFLKNIDDHFDDTLQPTTNEAKRRRIDREGLSPSTTSSQPASLRRYQNIEASQMSNSFSNQKIARCGLADISFTQPPSFDSLLIAKSQCIEGSQQTSTHPCHIIRRLTRFCVPVDLAQAIQYVKKACKNIKYETKTKYINQLSATSLISAEGPSFMISFYKMVEHGEQLVLVDFRRSKGDGIEFKRRFVEIKKMLSKIIYKDPIDWLGAQGSLQSTQTKFQRFSLDSDEEPDTFPKMKFMEEPSLFD